MCLVEHLASCAWFNPLFELSIHARPDHMLAGTLQACSLALMMHIDVFLDQSKGLFYEGNTIQ